MKECGAAISFDERTVLGSNSMMIYFICVYFFFSLVSTDREVKYKNLKKKRKINKEKAPLEKKPDIYFLFFFGPFFLSLFCMWWGRVLIINLKREYRNVGVNNTPVGGGRKKK